MELNGWQGPKGFNADDPENIETYRDYYFKFSKPSSKYIRKKDMWMRELILMERMALSISPMQYNLEDCICLTNRKILFHLKCSWNLFVLFMEWLGSMTVSS